MLMTRKVTIIGAGIAGLSTGCYLQMNGYQSTIFESHSIGGGLCTAWTRKGYTIDGGIEGLLGSSSSHPLYRLWSEIVDMKGIGFVDLDLKCVYDLGDGTRFHEHANIDKLRNAMISIAPEDSRTIEKFIRSIRKIQKAKMPVGKPRELFTVIDYLKLIRLLPLLPTMRKYNAMSATQFSNQFKNPTLRQVIGLFSSPILFEMFVLSEMDLKRVGALLSGSQGFAELFEKKYRELGGEIRYKASVSRILVNDSKAVGVELVNGERIVSDIVITAADLKSTLYSLLEGRYISEDFQGLFERMKVNTSVLQAAYGVAFSFENEPHITRYVLKTPYVSPDGTNYSSIDLRVFNYNSNYAPPGKTVLMVQLRTDNSEYWINLRKSDPEKYKSNKNLVSKELLDIVEERMGNVRDHVEMVDVATPATFNRYTNNWKGSTQGWANENVLSFIRIKKVLPGLSNFYLTGHWVEPGGGVPNAFMSGRNIVQIICREDGKRFRTVGDG
jgi:phytoene dehydrogenase-like protein